VEVAAPASGARLGGWLGLSVILHVAALTALLVVTSRAPVPSPPIYRVDLLAAPPGRRAVGIVTPAPPPDVRSPTAPPPPPLPTPQAPPKAKTAPVKAPPARARPTQTTPVPPPKVKPAPTQVPPPPAGGGPQGGKGADVANVQTPGIDFPFPGYLNNIVRQVALNFSPDNTSPSLRAEVAFLIRRDGSVTGFRFITRSGDYGFDLEAQGAIEKAGPSFGPLPTDFTEDALPVVFSFDPRLIR
jgi:periplasmic protein TonB